MKERVLKSSQSNVVPITPNLMQSISKFSLHEKLMSRSKKENTSFPDYPSWVHERLSLSWDFYPNPEKIDAVWPY